MIKKGNLRLLHIVEILKISNFNIKVIKISFFKNLNLLFLSA